MTTTSSEESTLDDAAVDEAACLYHEARHAEVRAHAAEVAGRFPRLEDVLSGRSTLGGDADSLRARFDELEQHPKGISGGREYLREAEAFVEELTSYVEMMRDLTGQRITYDGELMLGVLRRRQKEALLGHVHATNGGLLISEVTGGLALLFLNPILGGALLLGSYAHAAVADDIEKALKRQIQETKVMQYPPPDIFFESLRTTAQGWDGAIREAYALEWYHADRAAFERAYGVMEPYARAHVQRAFRRMLQSGCLDMGEKEMESYLVSLEPEEKPLFSQLE